jgi:Rieske 2Fe-2S family protein
VTGLQAALPRHHYVDPDSFMRERDHVLRPAWNCVGRTDDLGLTEPGSATLLPGRLAVVDLLGESVLVTTTRNGELFAHANVCRHRGSQVVPVDPAGAAPAPCAVRALPCPYHAWTYALDGSLKGAPHTSDVEGFDKSAFGLHRLGAGIWGGFVWLNALSAPPSTLLEDLGGVPDKAIRYPLDTLVVGKRMTYEVAANWKLLAENYNECYHCGPVHPELTRLVPAFGGGGQDLAWDDGIPHREGAWTFTMSGTSDRAPFPDLDDAEKVRHKGELVYPNLMLSLSAEHVAAFILRPRRVDLTTVDCLLLFAPSELEKASFDPTDAEELWEITNRQDWAICESVQRGMSSSRYTQGWYAPMEDSSLDIRNWLLPRLQADAP